MSLRYNMTLPLNLTCDVCRRNWSDIGLFNLDHFGQHDRLLDNLTLDISELMGDTTQASLLSLSLSLCLVLQVAWIYSRLLAFRELLYQVWGRSHNHKPLKCHHRGWKRCITRTFTTGSPCSIWRACVCVCLQLCVHVYVCVMCVCACECSECMCECDCAGVCVYICVCICDCRCECWCVCILLSPSPRSSVVIHGTEWAGTGELRSYVPREPAGRSGVLPQVRCHQISGSRQAWLCLVRYSCVTVACSFPQRIVSPRHGG